MVRTAEPVPGLDPEALTRWWKSHLDAPLAGRLTAELIAGGKSNLTYRISDGDGIWVLRRPPLGHVLETAHDMEREHRVVSALQPTPVPVPRTVAFCRDERVIGAPFYVMEFIDGKPYRTAAELAPLGPARVRRITIGVVDTLAALHAVDPAAVGLADFGRPDGFLRRQVLRWKKQLDASHSRELPGAEDLYRRLEASVETAERAGAAAVGIVHGDYRLDNMLFATDPVHRDRPAAVIDWEMATLGDTLTDVALLLVYQRMAAIIPGAVADVSTAPGFPGEDETLQRYAAGRGRQLNELGFHLGLASFKLVAILEGIHYRHLHGHTVGEGFDRIGDAAEPLLRAGLDAFTQHA